MLIKSAILILVAAAVISVLVVCPCCIVAGRADEAAENWMREHDRRYDR